MIRVSVTAGGLGFGFRRRLVAYYFFQLTQTSWVRVSDMQNTQTDSGHACNDIFTLEVLLVKSKKLSQNGGISETHICAQIGGEWEKKLSMRLQWRWP